MIQYATYSNQIFTLQQFGSFLWVAPGHHNVVITIEKLIQLGIMEEFVNSQGFKVYGIVDMIRLHIRYDEDDSIKEQLTQLILERNVVIDKRRIERGKRKNASDSRKKRRTTKHRNNDNIEDTDDTDNDNYEFDEVYQNHFKSKLWPLLP